MLKLTYSNLEFQKKFPGEDPQTPAFQLGEREKKGLDGEGKGKVREGRRSPKQKFTATPLSDIDVTCEKEEEEADDETVSKVKNHAGKSFKVDLCGIEVNTVQEDIKCGESTCQKRVPPPAVVLQPPTHYHRIIPNFTGWFYKYQLSLTDPRDKSCCRQSLTIFVIN